MGQSRRQFIKTASTAAAAGAIWPGQAVSRVHAARPIRDALGVGERAGFEPGALAALALDAARAAGAAFADVRVDRHITQLLSIRNDQGGSVAYGDAVGIGVRVIANGQWGFASTDIMTSDAIAETARRAAHQARVNAAARATVIDLAPAPAVSGGQWATRIAADPFAVPVGEQQEALLAGTMAALAVHGIKEAEASLSFRRVERFFASTEGSRIAQTFSLAFPGAVVRGTVADASVMADAEPEGFEWRQGGYEVVRDARLPDAMRAAATAALRGSRRLIGATPRSVDVGRYELVVGPSLLWGLVRSTILAALEMERALGKESDGVGTSYAAPPEKALGTMRMGAPLLTVRADRSRPGELMTAGWDDEGVKPDEFTLVERGVLLDYLATRENATALRSWYETRGVPVRAHGVATTSQWSVPTETPPNIEIMPGRADVTVDDLIRDVKHGIYIPDGRGAYADFGLMNAYASANGVREIRNGKIAGYLGDVAIQFAVQPFWQGLVAIGGPASVESFASGFPELFGCRTVRAVPARFKEVNVVNTGRTQ